MVRRGGGGRLAHLIPMHSFPVLLLLPVVAFVWPKSKHSGKVSEYHRTVGYRSTRLHTYTKTKRTNKKTNVKINTYRSSKHFHRAEDSFSVGLFFCMDTIQYRQANRFLLGVGVCTALECHCYSHSTSSCFFHSTKRQILALYAEDMVACGCSHPSRVSLLQPQQLLLSLFNQTSNTCALRRIWLHAAVLSSKRTNKQKKTHVFIAVFIVWLACGYTLLSGSCR